MQNFPTCKENYNHECFLLLSSLNLFICHLMLSFIAYFVSYSIFYCLSKCFSSIIWNKWSQSFWILSFPYHTCRKSVLLQLCCSSCKMSCLLLKFTDIMHWLTVHSRRETFPQMFHALHFRSYGSVLTSVLFYSVCPFKSWGVFFN